MLDRSIEAKVIERIDAVKREGNTLGGICEVVCDGVPVGIGSPSTPTPTGSFAVTDGLHWRGSRVYGCCVLALSGHQPQLAQGWTGGDRIAVHGTDAPATVGEAASLGCLHASAADMRVSSSS